MLYLNITGYHKVEGFKTKNVKYGNAGVFKYLRGVLAMLQ